MVIKHAFRKDIAALTAVETACFPPAEAATEKEFIDRVQYYGNHFWLLYEGDKLLAFVDGFVTDEPDLTDVMYEDAALHNEQGAWQMIFGVNTLPEYRRHGYAGQLLRRAIADARQQGRRGLVLTCKERLLPYYAKFGFQDEGVTDKSTHGNARVAPDAAFVLINRSSPRQSGLFQLFQLFSQIHLTMALEVAIL